MGSDGEGEGEDLLENAQAYVADVPPSDCPPIRCPPLLLDLPCTTLICPPNIPYARSVIIFLHQIQQTLFQTSVITDAGTPVLRIALREVPLKRFVSIAVQGLPGHGAPGSV